MAPSSTKTRETASAASLEATISSPLGVGCSVEDTDETSQGRRPEGSWTYKSGVHGEVTVGDRNFGAVRTLTEFTAMKLGKSPKGVDIGDKKERMCPSDTGSVKTSLQRKQRVCICVPATCSESDLTKIGAAK